MNKMWWKNTIAKVATVSQIPFFFFSDNVRKLIGFDQFDYFSSSHMDG